MRKTLLAAVLMAACCSLYAQEYLVRLTAPSDAGDPPLRNRVRLLAELEDGGLALLDAKELEALDAWGASAAILDQDPALWDYWMVGLRPDSDRPLLTRAGDVLHTESNWVLLRTAPGHKPSRIQEGSFFVAPLPREPLAAVVSTDDPLALRPAEPHAAVPLVQKIVSGVSTASIDTVWTALTTSEGDPTPTRYTSDASCGDDSTYCYNLMAGYGLNVAYQDYGGTSRAPNVIGTQTGAVTPSQVYVVVGHLDDMPSTGAAPGADDNASGTVVVLEAARAMSCYAFKSTVKYIAVTGEETGLEGSEAYAADAKSRNEDIRGVINMDMPGWAGDNNPVGENLDLNYDSNSQTLAQFYAQCATDYSTGLAVDAFLCPSLNASDHYPFWQQGYKAVCGITDNEGYCGHGGNYPYYHTANDTLANCGARTFFYAVNKTTVAALSELAEPFKITLDKSAYGCSGPVQIILGDRDLNTNPATAQTVTVSIRSNAESTPESVVLTEDGSNSMIFRGTISLTAAAPVHGDGLLSVGAGDTLTATYVDAADCDGATDVTYTATAGAGADCVAPQISAVLATNVTGNSARITWTTDESANSRVTYGTAIPPSTNRDDLANYVTSHTVDLTGLAECTTYYFSVTSADAPGNSATADNGGAFYTFTTGKNTQPTYASTDIPKTIADNTTVSSTISVPDAKTIQDLNVLINATHTYDGDVQFRLVGPDSTTVALITNRGGSGDNFTSTLLDDEAATNISNGAAPFTGSFRPEAPLTAFDGKSAAGTWTLQVQDTGSGDTGSLTGWSLQLTYPAAACSSHGTYQASAAVSDDCPAGGAGDGNGVFEPGETVQFSVTLNNDGTNPLTGVSATVTPVTAGVTMSDATATYADIAVGANVASQAPHFTAVIPSTHSCGTAVQFSVSITSAQGTWSGGTFSFAVGSPGGAQTTTTPSTDVPKAIPDPGTVESNVVIAATGNLSDVNVTITSLTHSWDSDVDIYLVHPDSTVVELSTDNGSSGDNYTNTVFDDAASTAITGGAAPFTGTFRPEGSLAALNGKPANGTWKLRVTDDTSSDAGNLVSWSLTVSVPGTPVCNVCNVLLPPGETAPGDQLSTAETWSDKNTHGWPANPQATGYKVLRGTPAQLPDLLTANTDHCVKWTGAGTSCALGDTPAEGSFYWYLVVGTNGGGDGHPGFASGGQARTVNSTGSCP